MGRRLRFVPQDHLVEVTCRTIHGRLLLRPSPALNDILVGALGRAQRVYGLRVFGLAFLSNHYHLLCGPEDAQQLARVMCLANSKIAREVGRLHGWKEKVWGHRYSAIVLTQESEVHVQRLRYILSHGVKEGLVQRVLEWPGVHCASSLLSGKPMRGLWFDRTEESRAKKKKRPVQPLDFATEETVKLDPLPCWAGLSRAQSQTRVQELIEDIENEADLRRRAGELRPRAMGPRRVMKQRPHRRPKNLKRSPAPAFHGKNATLLRALKEAYRAFVRAYLTAAERHRNLETVEVHFPEGSFPPALPFVRGSPTLQSE